jgi:chitinase
VPASLSVSDVTIMEGVAGAQNAAVIVSLSAPTNKIVTVNYSTADGTALAGSDYDAVSGKLTFARGQTSKTILVPVRGDQFVESDEWFSIKLSGARNAKITDGQATATIRNDDPTRPTISISDAELVEGNSGTTLMTFTVSLAAVCDQAVTVNFATHDGDGMGGLYPNTAIAGQDYLATSGTLTFAPGETTRAITVEIIGDPYSEFNETAWASGRSRTTCISAWVATSATATRTRPPPTGTPPTGTKRLQPLLPPWPVRWLRPSKPLTGPARPRPATATTSPSPAR